MFKTYMLDKVIGWLIGGTLFTQIKGIVAGLLDQTVPGEEKRKIAVAQAKELAGTTATFLLNLAIEAAYAILKTQQSTK